MNTKDIIKEIDPEYHRCRWCRRLIHETRLLIGIDPSDNTPEYFCCVDSQDCKKHIAKRENVSFEKANKLWTRQYKLKKI